MKEMVNDILCKMAADGKRARTMDMDDFIRYNKYTRS